MDYYEFKMFGFKAWAIGEDSIIYDTKEIPIETITSVKRQRIPKNGNDSGSFSIMANGKNYFLAYSGKQNANAEHVYEYLEKCCQNTSRQLREDIKKESEPGLKYTLRGIETKVLKVYEDRAVIMVRPSFKSFMLGIGSDGEKTIFYKDCIGIQHKTPGIQIGYIQLETGSRVINNTNSQFFGENSFPYTKETCPDDIIVEVVDYIKERIASCKNEKTVKMQSNAPSSAADEILKFKGLLDAGIITQEEFEQKKKQLLGL